MSRLPTRQRIVEAGAALFRRQGYSGTGLKQIATTAEAPFGSVYHFFPGGKAQLAEAATRLNGQHYLDQFTAIIARTADPLSGLNDYFNEAAEALRSSDFAQGCPIIVVAAEVAETNDDLRQVCAEVYQSWIDAGAAWLIEAGVADERAHEIAVQLVILIEGAFLLSQTLRSIEPMDLARTNAHALIHTALTTSAVSVAG